MHTTTKNQIRNTARNSAMAGLLIAASLAANTIAAHAQGRGDAVRLRSAGFAECQRLGNSGYTGIVQGWFSNGGGGNRGDGEARFRIRYCFETQRECTAFVGRIENIIHGVSQVEYRSCSRRG